MDLKAKSSEVRIILVSKLRLSNIDLVSIFTFVDLHFIHYKKRKKKKKKKKELEKKKEKKKKSSKKEEE